MHNNSIWKSFLACSTHTHLDNCLGRGRGTPLGAPLRRRECGDCLTLSLIMQLLCWKPKNKNLIFSLQICMCDRVGRGVGEGGKLISGVVFVAPRCASSLSPGANELQHSVRCRCCCWLSSSSSGVSDRYLCRGYLRGCSTLAMIKMFVLLQCRRHA